MQTCSICGDKVIGRGLCRKHYQALWRQGNLKEHNTKRVPIKERLLAKINFKNGCWEWAGGLRSDGYGMVWLDGKAQRVHRVSYAIFKEPLNKNDVLCHKCDNPKCINPDHIFVGTRADNVRDAALKNRMPIGSHHWNAKLNNVEIELIRNAPLNISQSTLAKQFNVRQSTISRIRSGKRRAKDW